MRDEKRQVHVARRIEQVTYRDIQGHIHAGKRKKTTTRDVPGSMCEKCKERIWQIIGNRVLLLRRFKYYDA